MHAYQRIREKRLKEEVSHAYYKYGRFCSSHPVFTILVSIISIILLSYPVCRLLFVNMPESNEIFLFSNETSAKNLPLWMLSSSPAFYIQQIFVRGKFDLQQNVNVPFSLDNDEFVKTVLHDSFDLISEIRKVSTENKQNIESLCLRVAKVSFSFLVFEEFLL